MCVGGGSNAEGDGGGGGLRKVEDEEEEEEEEEEDCRVLCTGLGRPMVQCRFDTFRLNSRGFESSSSRHVYGP